MTKSAVKKAILKKFGSLSRFARMTKRDRYKLQKLFQLKEPPEAKLAELMLAVESEIHRKDPNEIKPGDLAKLKQALKDYGGIAKFCRDFPQYKYRSVTKITQGDVTRISRISTELFQHFEIWPKQTTTTT